VFGGNITLLKIYVGWYCTSKYVWNETNLCILRDSKTSGDAFRLPYSIPFDCSIRPLSDPFSLVALYIPSFHVLRGRPRFFLPAGLQLIIIFGNRIGSILSTCPYQMSCFRVDCRSTKTYSTSGVQRGDMGESPPPHPHEIPKFWQSWAEFPVPWKFIRNNLIRIRVSLICQLSGTPD
jgi:hypothetical protein